MTRLPDSYIDQSISHATLLPEHLMAAFIPVLREADPELADRLQAEFDAAPEDNVVGLADRGEILASVFDALEAVAPDGTSFGSSEGDGSDFGFWSNESEDYSMERPEPDHEAILFNQRVLFGDRS